MGALQRPEHRSPGRELLAPELWEEPLTPEERRPRGERRGAGGSAFAHWGPLPPKEDALTPVSTHPWPEAHPTWQGRVLTLHARRLCPLSWRT